MKISAFSIFSVLLTMALTPATFAAASKPTGKPSAKSSTSLVQNTRNDKTIFSGLFNVSRSTSLVNHEDGSAQDAMEYAGRLNMNLNKSYVLRLSGGYSQNLNDSSYDDFSDTSLSIRHNPFALNKTFLMGWNLGATAPTSKDSSKRQSMIAALNSGMNVMVNPDSLIPGLGMVAGISLNRNLHQYETDVNGNVLSQYTSSQSFSISYDWPVGITLSADFVHQNAWTYQGNVKEVFAFTQELGYQMNNWLALGIGHTNMGSVLKPDGVESNISIVNENSSLVYASATIIF
ncbi:hypothetical protein [Bdellovibrio sp. HCB209]|uniref:hypothetical protein n=1 Tax=Bdellovibrio sp. HCB209 TaxID=3394354 RepID=UPI0039B3CD5B